MSIRISLFICVLCITPIRLYAFDYFQALPEQPLVPPNNALSAEKIQLGKQLFFDKALSKTNSYSCNHCHNLYSGGSDNRALSPGHNGQLSKRSAPGLWNIGLQTVLYWDGRVKTLEDQAKDHLLDKTVMAITKQELLQRLHDNGYKKAFRDAFGSERISFSRIANALASFERSLMSPDSPFDLYMKGNKAALSNEALTGMKIFNEAGCLACHFGVNFAGPAPGPAMGMGDGFYELFPNIRGTDLEKSMDLLSDRGRYEFSKKDYEMYMWRVPPLRNIALTAPYFHNGSAKTLEEAIKVMSITQFGRPLSDKEILQVATFLRSLTGKRPEVLN